MGGAWGPVCARARGVNILFFIFNEKNLCMDGGWWWVLGRGMPGGAQVENFFLYFSMKRTLVWMEVGGGCPIFIIIYSQYAVIH